MILNFHINVCPHLECVHDAFHGRSLIEHCVRMKVTDICKFRIKNQDNYYYKKSSFVVLQEICEQCLGA